MLYLKLFRVMPHLENIYYIYNYLVFVIRNARRTKDIIAIQIVKPTLIVNVININSKATLAI